MTEPRRVRASAVRGSRTASDEPNDLDDPVVQDQIMNPKPVIVKITGGDVTLYEFAARPKRKFTGFAIQVIAKAASINSGGMAGALSIIIGGVLADKFHDEFLPYVALAQFETGTQVTPAQITGAVKELEERCTAVDDARLFDALSEMHNVKDAVLALGPNG